MRMQTKRLNPPPHCPGEQQQERRITVQHDEAKYPERSMTQPSFRTKRPALSGRSRRAPVAKSSETREHLRFRRFSISAQLRSKKEMPAPVTGTQAWKALEAHQKTM